uniref:Uncharacterized protein n=2 Tax=Zea mays TaxID=4577 RepID=A0A804MKL2_MAIZE
MEFQSSSQVLPIFSSSNPLWEAWKGPYYWVKCKPDEPIPVSQPNQGSVRGRKEKKRIKQRKDFIMAEKKKRRAQYYAAVERKEAERT